MPGGGGIPFGRAFQQIGRYPGGKEFLDENFARKIALDDLSSRFYINKYYLISLFKERYGMTINAYLNQLRVTYIKRNLRFTEKTVEVLAAELDIDPTYLSRLFKKIEGVTPSEYRKQWSGNRRHIAD